MDNQAAPPAGIQWEYYFAKDRAKQELCRWVWSGRNVSESVLTKSIAKLRLAHRQVSPQVGARWIFRQRRFVDRQ